MAMTEKERKSVAAQRKSREARGQKKGSGQAGIGFEPPRSKGGGEVEVRRKGTSQEVADLEDRPGKEPQQLPEELEVFKKEDGTVTTQKQSIFQEEGELPPSITESVLKSVGLGVAIGVTAYTAGRLVIPLASRVGTRLLASRGMSIPGIIKTAGGQTVQLDKFGKIASVSGKAKGVGTVFSSIGGVRTPGRIAVNTATAAKATSFLTKLASTTGKTKLILGVLAGTIGLGSAGVGFFGLGAWGEKEGLEGLSFAYREAVNAEDNALADEIRQTYQESRDLVRSAEFQDFMPFVQVPETIRKINIKIDAADALIKSSDAKRKKTEEKTKITEEEPDPNIR